MSDQPTLPMEEPVVPFGKLMPDNSLLLSPEETAQLERWCKSVIPLVNEEIERQRATLRKVLYGDYYPDTLDAHTKAWEQVGPPSLHWISFSKRTPEPGQLIAISHPTVFKPHYFEWQQDRELEISIIVNFPETRWYPLPPIHEIQ